MKLVLFISCQFFITTVFAQWPTILDEIRINNLKGPVKKCIENVYAINNGNYYLSDTIPKSIKFFDEKGRLTEYWSDPKLRQNFTTTLLYYAASGNLEEIKEFDRDSSIDKHWVYTYDKKGRIIRETGCQPLMYGQKPIRIIDYKYNGSSLMIEKHYHTGFPIGGPSLEKEKFEHGYYEYDNNGFLVKYTVKRKGYDFDLLKDGTLEFINDTLGKPIVYYEIGKGKVRKKTEELSYYETGLLRESKRYLDSGVYYHKYEYEYDKHGNWTRKEEYEVKGNGKIDLKRTMIRTIIYY
jgi:hypothetical protein